MVTLVFKQPNPLTMLICYVIEGLLIISNLALSYTHIKPEVCTLINGLSVLRAYSSANGTLQIELLLYPLYTRRVTYLWACVFSSIVCCFWKCTETQTNFVTWYFVTWFFPLPCYIHPKTKTTKTHTAHVSMCHL